MNHTPLTLFAIASCFLKLGIQGFGGLGAVLALLARDLVERRGWLNASDLTEALTYTKLLPGSTIVQMVAYLGWKLRGVLGGLIATIAFLLPAFLVMLSLAISYRFLAQSAIVPSTLVGLTAAVVGLLLLTIWTLGRKNITSIGNLVVALMALMASVYFEINPAVIVIVAGFWGVLTEARKRPQ
ncbi:MAG: chromate transporter [Phormidesmis sp. CAN_BIN44]|nr:chromate transporter [Phormidesmis sp. CAN_BIN44]